MEIESQQTLEASEMVANEIVKQSIASQQRVVELSEKFKEAAKFLDESTDSIKTSWLVWIEESGKFLSEARLWRMAIEKETSDGIAKLKELSSVLHGEDSKRSLSMLKDFVDAAERLKALHDSGFLDKIKL